MICSIFCGYPFLSHCCESSSFRSQRPRGGSCPGNLSSSSPHAFLQPLHLPAEATPAKPFPSLSLIYSKAFGMNVADLSHFQAGGESCVPSSLYVHVFHIPGLYSRLSKVRVMDLKYLWRFVAKKTQNFRYRMLSWQVAVTKGPAVIFSRPKGFNVFTCRNGNGERKV